MTDRGVSVTVNFAMSLAIGTILLSVLFMGTGNLIEDRQENVIRTELQILGQRLAADLMAADRLAASGAEEVTITTRAPTRVGGKEYDIEVGPDTDGSELTLSTADPGVIVRVSFTNTTSVAEADLDGGDLEIDLDTSGELTVKNA